MLMDILLAVLMAEGVSLFAPEMLYVAAALEMDDARRKGLRNPAVVLAALGVAAAWAVYGRVPGIAALLVMIVHLAWCGRVLRGMQRGVKAAPFVNLQLFRALPEALLLRGAFVIPALALLAGLWYGMGIGTAVACVPGWVLYGLLRVYNQPRGAEIERFGARWVPASAVVALCAALGFNGVFSAVYCLWAALAALLPVQRNGRAWLCALLVLAQAALGAAGAWFGMAYIAWAAPVLLLPVILLQKGALYAAYLPLRAKMIRRRASR